MKFSTVSLSCQTDVIISLSPDSIVYRILTDIQDQIQQVSRSITTADDYRGSPLSIHHQVGAGAIGDYVSMLLACVMQIQCIRYHQLPRLTNHQNVANFYVKLGRFFISPL